MGRIESKNTHILNFAAVPNSRTHNLESGHLTWNMSVDATLDPAPCFLRIFSLHGYFIRPSGIDKTAPPAAALTCYQTDITWRRNMITSQPARTWRRRRRCSACLNSQLFVIIVSWKLLSFQYFPYIPVSRSLSNSHESEDHSSRV